MENLIFTTDENLRNLVATEVAAGLQRAIPQIIRQASKPPYLTTAQVLEITGWSRRTLQYRKAEGQITYITRGRLSLFPTDSLYSYLEEGRVPANEAA